ncbi:NAD(P)-dependent alcohol dehydrogenase [Paenibacillus soyae]|uniref:NAD(P)-dependent alcohol dehydrogenase n=1 Tax=Paenibacillus soyae TaxID=2969249 RepID=A0A9X2MP42_9BACL|nr:NAD(P)-dependent alcohol dehydrogenase [Paenibacillus soyae]
MFGFRWRQHLIQVFAASVNAYDWRHLRANPAFIRLGGGMLKPKHPILGADVSGRVEAVGRLVKQFRPGDEVFGEVGFGCFAEYVCGAERNLALKPAGSTFLEAASIPMAALTALQGLCDKGHLRAGQKVMIKGAAGGVGSYAVQIAKFYGAEVTGICSSSKIDAVRSMGADQVVDYANVDIAELQERFDLIFDTAAFRPIRDHKRLLRPNGKYVIAGGEVSRIFQAMFFSMFDKQIDFIAASVKQEDLIRLKELVEAGGIKPFIDRIYSFQDTAEAIRHVEESRAKGKVVVRIRD